jgi:pyruvate/2-oxoglutarate dehydrogenase complex dihydrolipoamide acyltransferase (E2) component
MQDVLVQLDSSFDQRPVYMLVAWLRHRDAQVTIGEPLAIIQDGDTRKVISAPCSGRIVAIYADPGAPLLPRSMIALIRPGLPLALPANGGSSILIAVALIAVIIVIVPMLNGTTAATATDTSPTPITNNPSTSWWPFDATPQPSSIPTQATETPGSDEMPAQITPPDANPTMAPEVTPAIEATPVTEAPPSPQQNEPLIKRIGNLINEMINLTNEIRPWVQTNQLINPQIYEQMIQPRISRNQKIIDQLRTIAGENAANMTLTPLEQQLISQLDQFISPCMAIYQEVQVATESNAILPDLSGQYGECNNGASNLVQYLSGQ